MLQRMKRLCRVTADNVYYSRLCGSICLSCCNWRFVRNDELKFVHIVNMIRMLTAQVLMSMRLHKRVQQRVLKNEAGTISMAWSSRFAPFPTPTPPLPPPPPCLCCRKRSSRLCGLLPLLPGRMHLSRQTLTRHHTIAWMDASFRIMVIKENRVCFLFEGGYEVREDIRLLDIEAVEQLDDVDALWAGGVDVARNTSRKKRTDRRLTHQKSGIMLKPASEHNVARTSFCIRSNQNQNHILRYLPAGVKRPSSLSPFYPQPHLLPARPPRFLLLLSRLHAGYFAHVKPCEPRTETPEQRSKALEAIESAIEQAVARAVQQAAQTPIERARSTISQVSTFSLRYPHVSSSWLMPLCTHLYKQVESRHAVSFHLGRSGFNSCAFSNRRNVLRKR